MSGSPNNVQETMEAAVEARTKDLGRDFSDKKADEEAAEYFSGGLRQRPQSFVKICAFMLTCASGALLTSTTMFAAKQSSWTGLVVDGLATCLGAFIGYYSIRQRS